MPIVNNCV